MNVHALAVLTAATAVTARAQICQPDIVANLDTPGAAWDTAVAGDVLFVCDGDAGLRLYLIAPPGDPEAPTLLGVLPTPAYHIAVEGSRAYITDGYQSGSGVSIVDVSSPASPMILGEVDVAEFFLSNLAVSGDFLYVGHDSTASIVDVSDPAAPFVVTTVGGAAEFPFVAFHDGVLFRNEADGLLHAYDVSDPASPVELGSAFIGFDHDGMDIEGGRLYAPTNGALAVVDVSDPTSMTAVLADDPAWVTNLTGIDVTGGVAYVTTVSGMLVLDVSTPFKPALLGAVDLPGAQTGVSFVAAHNGIAYVNRRIDGVHSILDVSACGGPPLITLHPVSQVADAGDDPVSFEIGAFAAAEFQWRLDGEPIDDGGPFGGTTTTMLQVAPDLATAGIYDVVVSNGHGESISLPAGLVVRNACTPDVNGDGVLNILDFVQFQNLFLSGCP